MGKIGCVAASIAKGFGCKVIANDPHADPQHAPCLLLPLDELLADSHVVSLHASLTTFEPPPVRPSSCQSAEVIVKKTSFA